MGEIIYIYICNLFSFGNAHSGAVGSTAAHREGPRLGTRQGNWERTTTAAAWRDSWFFMIIDDYILLTIIVINYWLMMG